MKPTKQIIEEIEREYEVLFNGKCAFPMDKLYPVRVKTYIMKDYIPSILSAFAEELIGEDEKYTVVGHKYGTESGEFKQIIGDEEKEWKDSRNDLRQDQRLKAKEIISSIGK